MWRSVGSLVQEVAGQSAGPQVASVSQAQLSPVPATDLEIQGSGVSSRILQPEWTRAARWRQADWDQTARELAAHAMNLARAPVS